MKTDLKKKNNKTHNITPLLLRTRRGDCGGMDVKYMKKRRTLYPDYNFLALNLPFPVYMWLYDS